MNALAFVIPFLGILILFAMLACKLVRNYQDATHARAQQQQAQIALENTTSSVTDYSKQRYLQKVSSVDASPAGVKIAFMPTGQLMYARPTLSEQVSLEQIQTGDTAKNSRLDSQDSGVVLYKTEISLSVQSVDLDEFKSGDDYSVVTYNSAAQNQDSQKKQILSQQNENSSNNC